MANSEFFNSESCYICNEFIGELRSNLTDITGHSEKTIYHLIESFSESSLPEDVINESGICQNCFVKFDEYDEHLTRAEQIQSEIVNLMETKFYTLDSEVKIKTKYCIEEVEVEEEISIADQIEFESYEHGQIYVADENQTEMGGEMLTGYFSENNYSGIPIDNIKKNKDQKKYGCDICARTFKEKSKLKSHREIHTSERNVICPTCGKTFKTQACLRSHKRVHNPVIIECDYCGKCYTKKPQLIKHIRFVHFQIREYFCNVCGSGFGSKGHLSTHSLTHQDQSAKTFICRECSMAFHTRAKLERHVKSHTKERNFECGICGKKFLYSYNVTAHIRHVHYREKRKESDSKCSFCGKNFHRMWKLREHMAEAHRVIEADESY